MIVQGTCKKCDDGTWACGTNPECPTRQEAYDKLEVMGHIQFTVELWQEKHGGKYMMRLVPKEVDSKSPA